MKNRIGVRSEYFNRKQAKGVAAHVKREFANDKNVIDPKLTAHNFGTNSDTYNQNYLNALQVMPDSVKNTLIDSMVVFPLERMRQLRQECIADGKDWRKEIDKAINAMAEEMENEMGFTFVGYKMHLDEGHHDANGKVVLNPHAHLHFANICQKDVVLEKLQNITLKDENGKAMRDPNNKSKWLYERDEEGDVKKELVKINLKGRAPLSLHQTRGSDSIWAKQQDIAAKHLKHLGFERGEKAEITKAKHLSKKQHAERALRKVEQKVESLALAEAVARKRLEALQNDFQKSLDVFIEEREELFTKLLSESVDLEKLLEEEKKVESKFYEIYDEDVRMAAKDSSLKRLDEVKPDDSNKPFNFDPKFDALSAKMQSYEAKEEKTSTAPKIELGKIR
ncbi:hypothetical protein [Photobacterium leiognathi]|uniref:hypothetical protein n=2 Tax=Photobacterium leiognathi TaxID=553611 RepID=UPI0029814A7C|nr:hypothetical protein [Photobacterium leiognathi]